MADTRIEWADAVWNPVSGCTRASSGCDNCYAVTMTKRLEAMGREKYSGLVNVGKGHFNGVVKCHEDELLKPLRWQKPRRIFVNSMSDLFHKDVPFDFIDKVFAVMALCPRHTFMVLTKRPERMAEYLASIDRRGHIAGVALTLPNPFTTRDANASFYYAQNELGHYEGDLTPSGFSWNGPWPLPNVWLGASAENQAAADERIPHLLKVRAAVRFLSCEPLLGPVCLRQWIDPYEDYPRDQNGEFLGYSDFVNPNYIHWVICGGESGPNARPMNPDWARSLRDQCQAAGVPFFFKQWGEWIGSNCNSCSDEAIVAISKGVPIHNWPDNQSFRIGKKVAGRHIDSRTWNEFPEVANG